MLDTSDTTKVEYEDGVRETLWFERIPQIGESVWTRHRWYTVMDVRWIPRVINTPVARLLHERIVVLGLPSDNTPTMVNTRVK